MMTMQGGDGVEEVVRVWVHIPALNKNVSYTVPRHTTLLAIKRITLHRQGLLPGPWCWMLDPVETPNASRIMNRSFVLRLCSSSAETPIIITQMYRSKKHPNGDPMIANNKPVPAHKIQNTANDSTLIATKVLIPKYTPGNPEQAMLNQYLNPGYSSYRHFLGGPYLPLYELTFGSVALGWNRALPCEAVDRMDIDAIQYTIDLTAAILISSFRTLDEFREHIAQLTDLHTADALERHIHFNEPLNKARGDTVCILERLSYYIGPLEDEEDVTYRCAFLAAHRSLTSDHAILRPGHLRCKRPEQVKQPVGSARFDSIEILMGMIISKVEDLGWDPLPRAHIRKACEALGGIPGVTAIDCLLWMAEHPANPVDEKDHKCNGTATEQREYHTENDPHPTVIALNDIVADLELRGELGKIHTIRTENDFDHFKAVLFRLDPDTHRPTACTVTSHPRGFDRWPQFDLELRIVTKDFRTADAAYNWSRKTRHYGNDSFDGQPSHQKRKRGREKDPAEIKGHCSPRKKLRTLISPHSPPSPPSFSTLSPSNVPLSTHSTSATTVAHVSPQMLGNGVPEVYSISEDEENPMEMATMIQASLMQVWQTGPKKRVSHMPVRSVSNNDDDEMEKATALNLELRGEDDELAQAIALSLELREEENELQKAIALSLELDGKDACLKKVQ